MVQVKTEDSLNKENGKYKEGGNRRYVGNSLSNRLCNILDVSSENKILSMTRSFWFGWMEGNNPTTEIQKVWRKVGIRDKLLFCFGYCWVWSTLGTTKQGNMLCSWNPWSNLEKRSEQKTDLGVTTVKNECIRGWHICSTCVMYTQSHSWHW